MLNCFLSVLEAFIFIFMLIFIVQARDVIVVINIVSVLLISICIKLTIVEAETMIF